MTLVLCERQKQAATPPFWFVSPISFNDRSGCASVSMGIPGWFGKFVGYILKKAGDAIFFREVFVIC